MPKRLALLPHLTSEQLQQRYRAATDPVERSHFHILWLLSTGHTSQQVATLTTYSLGWVRTLARRYNAQGPQGLTDHRHTNPGAQPLLDEFQLSLLLQHLQQSRADGSRHTSYTVARWMSEQLGRAVCAQRGWEYLKLCERSLHTPRPAHGQADPGQQEAFKKLPQVLQQVQQAHPQAQVELWTMDEHRLGLKPLLCREWQPVGFPFVVPVRPRYRWLWVYAFVCPQSGQTEWLIAPTVSIAWFNLALEQFAQAVGAGADKRVVLVLDGAGWHRGKQVVVPEGIDLVFLPPYSPQLQPAERLWTWLNEAVANQLFETLEGLEEALAERCRVLSQWQGWVSGLTQFHWWPGRSREE